MSRSLYEPEWHPKLVDPSGLRTAKPRKTGRTMIIDKGLGIRSFKDLLETSAPFIDMIKIGFGTSALYSRQLLSKKIHLAKQHDIHIYPGGTFLEVAIHHNVIDSFFNTLLSLGFNSIEVSDGTIELSRQKRNDLIYRSLENGLTVYTEYGKKFRNTPFDVEALVETVKEDLEQGASLVTVEARESGIDVGIFDQNGNCCEEELVHITNRFLNQGKEVLLWETPLKSQQTHLIRSLGNDVNLGNIAPQDILSVESLRRGLRADTFVSSVEHEVDTSLTSTN